MSVRKTATGQWRSLPWSGKTQLPTRTFPTRREALAWEVEQKAQYSAGTDSRLAQATVASVLPERLAYIRASRKSVSTVRNAEWILGALPSWFLHLRVRDVTEHHIESLLNSWHGIRKSEPPATSTLKRVRAELSGFFSYLHKRRAISANPVRDSRVPEGPAPRTGNPLSFDELAHAYTTWRSLHVASANAAYVMGNAGLRWGEVRALRAVDLIPNPGHLEVHVKHSWSEGSQRKLPKNGTVRMVPVNGPVADALLEAACGKSGTDLVFPSMHRKRFMERLNWDETMPGRCIHDLRHTAITNWLACGVDIVTAKTWAGHKDIATTNNYAHHIAATQNRIALEVLSQRHA